MSSPRLLALLAVLQACTATSDGTTDGSADSDDTDVTQVAPCDVPGAICTIGGLATSSPVAASTASFAAADEELAGLDGSYVGPIADARDTLQDAVDEGTKRLRDVTSAVELLPPMLGNDGPRHYLLVPQRSGEIQLEGPVLNAQVADGTRSLDPFMEHVFGQLQIEGGASGTRALRLRGDPVDQRGLVKPLGGEAGGLHGLGDLLARIKGVRKKFAQDVGFLPPPVHVRDNLELRPSA